ncbi:DUF503 domain-containing protein [Chondromyces apiculatus]|uniref:YlxP-like protein n=1 Tax=Chondromyces apiculatus DSM 436 TaxID=1192034 RepID=A0A017SZR4_9BACT|nr:DUF503 domain-containing protein [Chondromyces apiculatus]EYF02257.1 YlxP-like protein [Chondromyces apiculatus DSM 436]
MFVGILRLRLEIVGSRSLKDKRRVVKSMKERAQARFRVSVAEVGQLDDPRRATLGVAVVSNESAQCDRVLADVAAMAGTLPDAVLADRATEIVSFGEGGSGVQGGIEQALGPSWSAAGDEDDDDDDDEEVS